MKNIYKIVLCLLAIICSSSIKVNARSLSGVKGVPLLGIVTEEGKKCKDAVVQVYDGNDVIQEFLTPANGRFKLTLEFNHYYTLKISKNGMVAKVLAVDTRVKSTRVTVPVYECDIDLIPSSLFIGMNTSILDFPMAIVRYNRRKGEFEHNEDYTAHMRTAYEELLQESFAKNEASYSK
ncbi:MAG: hypothetical protein ACPGED_00775 [Flavobacteriales bacterium]